MNHLASLYPAHVAELQQRCKTVLARENYDGIVIHSGKEIKAFLDDYTYPFKVNPHFKHWLPLTDVPNSWLIVNGADKPTLIYYQPIDFWHKITELDNSYWNDFFDIKKLNNASEAEKFLPYDKKGYAYIGENIEVATALGFYLINPEAVLNYLHYHRAYKTAYEQACIREANRVAVIGHKVAKLEFLAGATEFEIQQNYLTVIQHTANCTPYGNIIAFNEHAAILHYGDLQHSSPLNRYSFLIDAGASFHGYAADITRTYSANNDKFGALIERMNRLLLDIVDKIKPGLSYGDLHQEAYRDVGQVLYDFDFIHVDADTAVNSGIISTFFPHGLGHHLGLQTHDVGGFMVNERGIHLPPPKEHAFLRTTRTIESNHVLTIEPGLYFIPSLLSDLKNSKHQHMINWAEVDEMRPFGGIRIEDNIIVHQTHNENITRDAEKNSHVNPN
jgi:Xaa-Pro dipeptidase